MANLKAIRSRIKSVESTQKITRAMRLVAGAKVKRAQQRTLSARPFTMRVVRMLREIVRETPPIDLFELSLLQRRPINKVALMVLSSDRGLCGSYNTNVLRATQERIRELTSQGKSVSLIIIGSKADIHFRHTQLPKLKTYTMLPAVPTIEEARLMAEQGSELFVQGTVDAIEIIATQFLSMLNSKVINFQFLPVALQPASGPHAYVTAVGEAKQPPAPMADEARTPGPVSEAGTPFKPLVLFEPSLLEVLKLEVLPKYVENVVFQALLESATSELAARMNAMQNASANAADLIAALTMTYNKARQAAITQELLEIVGGAEALRG
jgi:F-type H+-transporting ATPase subunit gamma